MKKAFVLGVLVVILILTIGSNADAANPRISCHIQPEQGRIIANFYPVYGQDYLLANGTEDQAFTKHYGVNLPAGNYRVWLEAYDAHSVHGGQNQPNEQYYLIFRNTAGNIIAYSNSSFDIAENSDYQWPTVINEDLALNGNVSSVMAYHSAYPNSNPNSVYPVCAAFDPISTPTPTPTPTRTPTPSPTPTRAPNLVVAPPACSSTAYNNNITFYVSGTPLNGNLFTVDISTSSNFNQQYTKSIETSLTSISTGGDGFLGIWPDTNQTLSLQPNITYYARPWNGTHGNVVSFRVGNCATPTPTPTPTRTPSPTPTTLYGALQGRIFVDLNGNGIYDEDNNVFISDPSGAKCSRGYIISGMKVSYQGPNSGSVNPTYCNESPSMPYWAAEVRPGQYTVSLSVPSGWRITTPSTQIVSVPDNQAGTAWFGVAQVTTPTSTPTPSQIPSPVASTFCSSNTSKANLYWNEAQRGSQGYYVDIDNDTNWSNGFWNKFVSSGTTTTLAPDSFSGFGTGQALTLYSGTTYYLRVYYVASAEHSPVSSFSAQNCGTGQNPSLSMTKLVRNVSQNSGETDNVSARPYDTLEYIIRATNSGNGSAYNVRINDILPTGLNFQYGSVTIDNGGYVSNPNNIISGGINVGTLSPGQRVTVIFRANVREDSYFSYGNTTLTNTAYSSADSVASVNDSAYAVVNRSGTQTLLCSPSSQNANINNNVYFSASGGNGSYTWTAYNGNPSYGYNSNFNTRFSNSGAYDVTVRDGSGQSATCRAYISYTNQGTLFIDKVARNITTGSGEMNVVPAKNGDTIEFVIRVTTSGNYYMNNVRVSDTLPAGMQYIQGSTTVDGSQYDNNIIYGGINIGNKYGTRTHIVRFRAKVSVSSNYYGTLSNVAYTSADGIGSVSDNAYVSITSGTTAPGNPLSIQKLGKNLSTASWTESASVNGNPGNTLDFFIKVKNVSSETLYNVVVRDQMPNEVQYIQNTTSLNGVHMPSNDNIVLAGGLNIGTLVPNQEAVIRFSGVIRGPEYFFSNTSYIKNKAYVRADGIAEISAQLPITVRKGSLIGSASKTQSGANNSTMLMVFPALLAAVIYMAYTKTGLFKREEAYAFAKRTNSRVNKFNFNL